MGMRQMVWGCRCEKKKIISHHIMSLECTPAKCANCCAEMNGYVCAYMHEHMLGTCTCIYLHSQC